MPTATRLLEEALKLQYTERDEWDAVDRVMPRVFELVEQALKKVEKLEKDRRK